jgi:hypothetical protein
MISASSEFALQFSIGNFAQSFDLLNAQMQAGLPMTSSTTM